MESWKFGVEKIFELGLLYFMFKYSKNYLKGKIKFEDNVPINLSSKDKYVYVLIPLIELGL